MKGGHNRTSARKKRLAGTIRRDRQRRRPRVVVKDVNRAAPPFWLKGMALQKWREISQKLADHQVGSDLDVDIIADAAQHWALMVEGKNAVERDGVVVKNAKGRYVKHPALQIYRDESKAFRECLSRLGMTPVDRGKLDVPDGVDEDDAFFQIGRVV